MAASVSYQTFHPQIHIQGLPAYFAWTQITSSIKPDLTTIDSKRGLPGILPSDSHIQGLLRHLLEPRLYRLYYKMVLPVQSACPGRSIHCICNCTTLRLLNKLTSSWTMIYSCFFRILFLSLNKHADL